MRRPLHILLALLLLAFAVAVAAGCGDDDEPSDEPATSQEPSTEESEDEPEGPGPGGQQDPGEVDPTELDPFAAAGIDPATGAFRGLEPDTREGTPPPPAPGSLEEAAQEAGCTLQLDLRDETEGVPSDKVHLEPGDGHPKYGTKPPNSGRHDPVPVADGSYRETPPDTNVVHSLEHGRVAIQYAPSLPDREQLALKGLFDEDPNGMLLFPNADMPYDVAVTAWTNLMGCNEPSDPEALAAAVLAFRDQFRGRGPEAVPL